MKDRLKAMAFAMVMTLPLLAFAQATDAKKETPKDPSALTLPADDQKQLDLINDRREQMKPQLEAAKKQRDEAQARLSEANNFIAQYDLIETARAGLLFRIAADVCHCETKELEFSADGKRILRKKNGLAKGTDSK